MRTEPGAPQTEELRPFDIHAAMARIREAVRGFPGAALFVLAEEGYHSPFEILVACILSIRTRDEVMLPAARRLFRAARTPNELAALPADEIDRHICDCAFHAPKARQVQSIAARVAAEYDGRLPCDESVLLGFHGVGPKCANLVLGIACDQPRIGVDTHVHRIANRWGYVSATSPERTLTALESRLPRQYWVEINRLLVPFGKHVCMARLPACSTCPVREMCARVGVAAHR